jgi:CRP-like cAMP-binding protein
MSEEPIIKNISQHIQLDEGEVDYFLSLLQPKTIKRKEYLLRPNEVCKYESFIIKGCLRTYTIDNDGLEHIVMLYQKVPKFERFFRIILQNAFVAQQQRINQNLSFTAEERYLHFIKKYPRLEQRLPQKQVAAYLGITPEFLSMIRRKLAGK